LLRSREIREAWLLYENRFPHVSSYFRKTSQYRNQISIINGKKAGTDINLYKLFLEQCFNLLNKGGRCGIILQSGIYTDLGTKQLRELLFTRTKIGSLFGFSNEKFIFEAVHHAQKFCLLVFETGAQTQSFEAAFRINPREAISPGKLAQFLDQRSEHVIVPVSLVRRLSPDSSSVLEFKNELDVRVAEKLLRFPLLGQQLEGKWKLKLNNEFHMTNDSYLFKMEANVGRLPLYEGKMVNQFDHRWGMPRYWITEAEGR